MKKIISLMLLMVSVSSAFAIYQMRNWTLPPNKVFMQYGSTPVVTSITGAPDTAYIVANGVYDENNNLLFYVKDGVVYDASSNSIGTITTYPVLKEIVIVPVPGACRKYYVIMGHPVPYASSEILVAVVDCSSGSPSITSGPTQVAFFNGGGNVLGLAASTIISGSGSSAIRYLYVISYAQLHRLTISSSGVGSLTTLTNFYPVISEPTELELRHDGAKLAWGNYSSGNGQVYEILTSSPYTVTTYTLPPITPNCTTSNHNISGIEYDWDGNLWVSATSSCNDNKGIYKITTTSPPSYLPISGTQAYDKTQLELSIYDYILGLSNSGTFGYIYPPSNTFSTTSLYIPITVQSNSTNFSQNVYSLPDQIDHEIYYYFNGIEQGVADFKINNVVPSTNCSPIQEVYNCIPITFTNFSAGATSYTLEVNSIDGSCNVTGGLNYNSGTITTLPTDLRSMPGTNGTWLASNTGRFKVTLTANNGCSTTSKYTYIQVNGTPTTVSSCYTYVNNTTCTGSGISGGVNCVSAVSVCQNNPKIKADCSGGQFVQGSFDLVIDEYNSSCDFIKNVANSLNNPLTSTADLVCLSLNDFTTTPGYFYGNTPNLRYKVALTIRNVCSSNTTTTWFIDSFGGCKTDEDNESEIAESIGTISAKHHNISAQLFPNPSSGNSTLEFNWAKAGIASVYFSDMQGKVIYRHTTSVVKEGTQSMAIPSANWAAGIYFYQLTVGDAILQDKMIKTD